MLILSLACSHAILLLEHFYSFILAMTMQKKIRGNSIYRPLTKIFSGATHINNADMPQPQQSQKIIIHYSIEFIGLKICRLKRQIHYTSHTSSLSFSKSQWMNFLSTISVKDVRMQKRCLSGLEKNFLFRHLKLPDEFFAESLLNIWWSLWIGLKFWWYFYGFWR